MQDAAWYHLRQVLRCLTATAPKAGKLLDAVAGDLEPALEVVCSGGITVHGSLVYLVCLIVTKCYQYERPMGISDTTI
jgi:hypothetical protein